MPMSWQEFRTFLMNAQPFRIRRMFFKLNEKGANLPMLGSQREQVHRLMETFRIIPGDQQRDIFPEYFRDGVNITNNVTGNRMRLTNPLQNGRNNDINEQSNLPTSSSGNIAGDRVGGEENTASENRLIAGENQLTATRQPAISSENRLNATHQRAIASQNRLIDSETRLNATRQRAIFLLNELRSRSRARDTSLGVNNPGQSPHTPNLELRSTLSNFAFNNSPLRLAPVDQPDRTGAYGMHLTPRRQRRASITGSPAPLAPSASAVPRRRSMSVSAEGKGTSVTVTEAEDRFGKMANLECKICMDNVVECAIRPCGHACACYECARHLQFSLGRCPICRGVIAEAIRIYW